MKWSNGWCPLYKLAVFKGSYEGNKDTETAVGEAVMKGNGVPGIVIAKGRMRCEGGGRVMLVGSLG